MFFANGLTYLGLCLRKEKDARGSGSPAPAHACFRSLQDLPGVTTMPPSLGRSAVQFVVL
jgi:hypothetical protein